MMAQWLSHVICVRYAIKNKCKNKNKYTETRKLRLEKNVFQKNESEKIK